MSPALHNAAATETSAFNATELEERQYLASVTQLIAKALKQVHDRVVSRHDDMMEIKQQLQEHSRDLDHIDKANLRQAADMASRVGEHSITQRKRLERLLDSPYFGRIDCLPAGEQSVVPIYIGVHSFSDPHKDTPLIHDWRAPVSSMFYDFELGPARYEAPSGPIHCSISLKRQYRIERQQFRFMLESALNIQDDVLQEELSRASDDKLKTIVATIQRDQNAIIRNDHAHTLVIQGAAGSGKTSIALHRIAYLLYKHKETISSNDILIVSPNKVFAHYISQVLPELGEQMIRETTMEAIANELLDEKYRFQTFAEQVSLLLANRDPEFAERIRFKATTEFVEQLDRYIDYVRSTNLQTAPIRIGFFTLDSNWVADQFRKRSRFSISQQLNGVVEAVVDHMKFHHQKPVVGKERARVRSELRRMISDTNLKTIYKNFYVWLNRPEMLKPAAKAGLEYCDVFPLVYLKMMLDGTSARDHIKHVVIDEMQDYTPIQYRVISTLFPSRKTVLGDRNQSVNPLSSSSAEVIKEVLPDAQCVYMQKSYRSTLQITEVAQSVLHNPDLVPIERHGDAPTCQGFRSKSEELAFILAAVQRFRTSGHKSLGIICKTPKQAATLHAHLASERDVMLIDAGSTLFTGGAIVTTAYLAKGLEFDQVVVPFCSERDYSTPMDRHMLYVAITRAMHSLTLTYTGSMSPFLKTHFATDG